MSIATEITRLTNAKANIKAAIEAKGVTVASSVKLDAYDDLIEDIAGGVVEESSSANLDSYLSSKPVDSVYEYTGTSTSTYKNGRLYRIISSSLYDGLTFSANTAGSTIAMSVTGTPTLSQNFSYSTDNSTWNTFTPGTTTITLTNAGDKVYFKGNNPNGINESSLIYYKFIMTGSIAASGNIMSLIDNGACNTLVIPNNSCFEYMFSDCIPLTTPPTLPATTLTTYCYGYMFKGCTSLATSPLLSATILAQGCYCAMFKGCSSLITPPSVLPATTLAYECYRDMYTNCTSLTVAPTLPATTLADDCYYTMFNNCSALIAAPTLPATTLAKYCYYGMFSYCSSLVTLPSLPATTLADDCYRGMFSGCTSLQVNDTEVSGTAEHEWRIPQSGVFTNTSSQDSMFSRCAGTVRSSNDMDGVKGQSYTYYTQNTPV